MAFYTVGNFSRFKFPFSLIFTALTIEDFLSLLSVLLSSFDFFLLPIICLIDFIHLHDFGHHPQR